MTSVGGGLGAIPIILDLLVGVADIAIGFWIVKYSLVLFNPPSQKLNEAVGVNMPLNTLVTPLNPLSDPINALSQPLRSVSSLLFGWNSPFGVIRLHETYDNVQAACQQAFYDGVPMPKYNVGGFVLQPNAVDIGFVQVIGWYVTRNDPTTPGISSFTREYVLGWDAGGNIIFDQP